MTQIFVSCPKCGGCSLFALSPTQPMTCECLRCRLWFTFNTETGETAELYDTGR